jgi:acetyltransferase-like isoleucine patch superfamily enzyme
VASLKNLWVRFWMHFAGRSPLGRFATRLACWAAPPYKGRCLLAWQSPRGYISPWSTIDHSDLRLGKHVYIGDRVVIYQDRDGGPVVLGEGTHLHNDVVIEIGPRGSFTVGAQTHIQRGCQITAYESSIEIGRGVQIAPYCAFYSYDHGMAREIPMTHQPLRSKGPINVGDGAWLGVGVIVLSGVRIGRGAVVGAGAVVTDDVPESAIVAGVPARLIRMRAEMPPSS